MPIFLACSFVFKAVLVQLGRAAEVRGEEQGEKAKYTSNHPYQCQALVVERPLLSYCTYWGPVREGKRSPLKHGLLLFIGKTIKSL